VIGGLCSGAAYDNNHELVISFGGTGAGGAKNRLYVYDAYANSLHLLKPGTTRRPRVTAWDWPTMRAMTRW